MASIPELPQPGVEVIQEFRTVTPSIAVPTLVPCVVGVCKEIRELYEVDSTGDSVLNTDILVSGPAIATASIDDAPEYAVANATLSLRINGGVEQNFTFPASPATMSAQEAASAINAGNTAEGIEPVGFSAYVVQDDAGLSYLQLRGSGSGESETIQFTYGDANAIFGFGDGQTVYGIGSYIQDRVYLQQASFPDPRGNLEELDIDEDSIRVFLDLGTSVVELLQTETYLRRGSSIAAYDDSDGDQLTPYIDCAGEDFKAVATSAYVDGSVDLNSNRQEINQLVLAMQLDGLGKQFVKFYGAGIISDAAAGWNWGNITGNDLLLTVNGVAVSVTSIVAASLQDLVAEINVASQAAVGANVAYESNAAGTEQTAGTGTYLGLIYGAVPSTSIDKDADVKVLYTSTPALMDEIFGSLGTSGTGDDITADTPVAGTATLDDAGGSFTADMVGKYITITGAAAGGNNGTFEITGVNSLTQIEIDNSAAVTVVGDGFTYIVHGDIAQPLWGDHTTVNGGALVGGPYENIDIEAQIDAIFGSSVASIETGDILRLTSPRTGEADSKIEILGNPDSSTDALTQLGLSAGVTYGGPFPARVGDYLYADGTFIGMIIEVHPGAVTARLKLDREVSTDTAVFNPSTWYIVAKNLDTVPTSNWGTTVPRPDLQIDNNGDVIVKHDFLRDTTGAPIVSASAPIYCMYDALRLDVTAAAEDPALLVFDTTTQLDSSLDPVTPDNPLSYGFFCALGNANGSAVSGLGVSAYTEDSPWGTLEAYQEAFEFLTSEEVYAIALMTDASVVLTAAQSHVNQMSDPEEKGERIVIGYLGTPTRKLDDILVSGNDGDSVAGGPPYYFDTKIATLSQQLLAYGVDPTSSFGVDADIFLDLPGDAKNWNLEGPVVDGTKLKINTTFASTENLDGFYADASDLSVYTGQLPLVSTSFSVKKRGSAVASKTEEIETIYYRGQGYSDRRVWIQQLDKLRATVSGSEQLVEGFYMNAAKAGMVGGLNPAQPLTNYPIAVFTGVTGTKDRYSTSQLNQGAAGGADWVIQNGTGAPLVSRHQVTTDLTSVEKREQSIVKAVDFCAKFYRSGLQPYVGRYNITQSYLDTLSAVVQGFGAWLVEQGRVVLAANLNNLIQSEDSPDTVLIDVSLEVFYPGNYLRLTLIV